MEFSLLKEANFLCKQGLFLIAAGYIHVLVVLLRMRLIGVRV